MNDTTTKPASDKKAQWSKDRNDRRRQRYENDPEYRDAQKAARRDGYQKRNKEELNCTANLAHVGQSGAMMAVSLNNSSFVIGRVFTQADAAKMLNRRPQVFYRWHQRGIFPNPVLHDDKGNFYYSDEEVTNFIKIMGEHQAQTPHYRIDHDDTRERLFAASFSRNPKLGMAWVLNHR